MVRSGIDGFDDELVGFRDGWRGVLENSCMELDIEATRGILPRGGTILGSSRTNPYKRDDGVQRVRETLAELRLDAVIAVGGEDTLGVGQAAGHEGVNVVGVPKTIDNDLSAAPTSPSASTPRCRSRPKPSTGSTPPRNRHHRIMVVEVMGRHAGWIATTAASPAAPTDPDPGDSVRHRRGVRAS